MKRILAAIVLLFTMSTVARADEASKRVKIEKLLSIMHMDRMMDQLIDTMHAQVTNTSASMGDNDDLNREQKLLRGEMQEKMFAIMKAGLSWDKLEPTMSTVYAARYTEEEIDGMYAFYSSPVGQSVLIKMPETMQESNKAMQGTVQKLQQQLKALGEDYAAKIKAAGIG